MSDRRTIGVLWFLVALAGCTVGPDYVEPPTAAETAPAFVTDDATFSGAAEPATEWWLSFNDATLTSLVDDAMRHNYEIQVAQANVLEARELLVQADLNRYPIVTANGGYERQHLSTINAPSPLPRDQDYFYAGFDAGWELDIFGGVRRSIEAAAADVGALEAQRSAVLLTVVAEVARNYMELRGIQESIAIANANADNQRATYELTVNLLEGGRGTELDTSRANAQLQTTLATIPALERAFEIRTYRLAVLTGREPTALTESLRTSTDALPAAPAIVAIGNPIALLRNRPDVRGAERALAAATARVGVQTADLYPHVSIIGTLGIQTSDFADFASDGGFFTIGPRLTWAAFDLGRVQARIRAAGYAADAQTALFQQTVLGALEEVQASLTTFSRERARLDHLRQAANSSRIASALARQRYEEGGIGDFLTVLDAELRALESEQAVSESRTATMTAVVAVYKALGCTTSPPG